MDGTPRALLPISDEVLALVARHRDGTAELRRLTPDELRRIELCALATREASRFFDLYGGSLAAAPEVPEQRSAPGGLPEAEGCGCGGPTRGCPCS
jgi:hypothetical protein